MFTMEKKILIFVCVLHFTAPSLCAQGELLFSPAVPPAETPLMLENDYTRNIPLPVPPVAPARIKVKKYRSFLDHIDKKVYEDAIKIKDEKRIAREQWQEFLGVDVFSPYFKAQEIENKICDKTKIEIFHMKGRLKIEDKKVRYTFKIRF
jgi:hypothetical protein